MHLRHSTNRRDGKIYRYAQLVESYRGDDGKPAVKVIAHLGRIPDALFDALRVALEAARLGEALVLESDVARRVAGTVLANLRFLDLRVLMECWDQWGLSELIDGLADSDAELSLAEVVLPLVAQRCVDPGSKLRAVRWVRRTALPELVGFEPSAFNNSRIHRALERLHEIDRMLQERLTKRYLDANGSFSACFMDVTDTYFEGMGPELVEQTRTKSEMPNKRCIGIVLLVNERGFPLRWKLVGGKTKDWTAMSSLLREIGEVPWLEKTIIVFDRAMGNRSTIAELKESGLHFLTAAHRDSIKHWTSRLPTEGFDKLQLGGTDDSYENDIKAVAQAARKLGWTEIHDQLFTWDLGVCTAASEESEKARPKRTRRGRGIFGQLERAHRIRSWLDEHPGATHRDAATEFDVSSGRIAQILSLLRLAPEARDRITQYGEDFPCTETEAWKLVKLEPAEQLARIDAMVAADVGDTPADDAVGPLRMVAYFNPRLFVDMRARGERHCREIDEAVASLNAELAVAKRSRDEQPTFRKFSRELERRTCLDAFDIELEAVTLTSTSGAEIRSFHGTITRKESVWAARRAYDGCVLLLGHPELRHTGIELVQHYRGKDVVEKDFQTIKSVVELRPLFHYTDPKVAAHVSICMLAVLLLRTLEQRLKGADVELSARGCLEELSDCHLNVRRASPSDALCYDLTAPRSSQSELLQALALDGIAEPEPLRARLQARPVHELS